MDQNINTKVEPLFVRTLAIYRATVGASKKDVVQDALRGHIPDSFFQTASSELAKGASNVEAD